MCKLKWSKAQNVALLGNDLGAVKIKVNELPKR